MLRLVLGLVGGGKGPRIWVRRAGWLIRWSTGRPINKPTAHAHAPRNTTDVVGAEPQQEEPLHDHERDHHGGESALPGYEGEAFDYCGGGPYAPLLKLRGGKHRVGPRERARAAADKAERLGGCPLRSQYGSPLCVVM